MRAGIGSSAVHAQERTAGPNEKHARTCTRVQRLPLGWKNADRCRQNQAAEPIAESGSRKGREFVFTQERKVMNYLFSQASLRILESLSFTQTLYAFDFDGTLAPIVRC